MEKAPNHRPHRQGDERRSGQVSRGGRQRLHRQTARRGETPDVGEGVDAEVAAVMLDQDFDLELRLLLDAINLKYHYDFRRYAVASLKRRLARAMVHFGCETLSRLQDKVLHEPGVFPRLLDFLTVQVSEMFRDPPYFRSLREKVVPAAAHLSVAEGVGGRLQCRRRSLFARHS